MGIIKSTHITLLGAFLLAVGTASAWAQPAQYTGDQNQSDSNTARKDKKSEKADGGVSASQSAPDSGATASKKTTPNKPMLRTREPPLFPRANLPQRPQLLGKRLPQTALAWYG
jgi:hypothetical protein